MIQDVDRENIDYMAAIRVERTNSLLFAEQPKSCFGKVKKGADTRVSLVVIVAECAFIVAVEAGNPPVRNKSPVVAKALVQFNLHRLIYAPGILVSIRFAISVEFSSEGGAATRLLTLSQIGAIGEEAASGIGPSAGVDGGGARAAEQPAERVCNSLRDIVGLGGGCMLDRGSVV